MTFWSALNLKDYVIVFFFLSLAFEMCTKSIKLIQTCIFINSIFMLLTNKNWCICKCNFLGWNFWKLSNSTKFHNSNKSKQILTKKPTKNTCVTRSVMQYDESNSADLTINEIKLNLLCYFLAEIQFCTLHVLNWIME